MGKSATPPPAPDYTGAAERTAESSQRSQTRADWANRPQQNTPWGSSAWTPSAGTDPSTGEPITSWEQNLTLSGPQQQALEDQMAVQSGKSNIAQGMLGRLDESYQKPFDPSGLQATGAVPQADSAERQRIENMMFERMAPEHQKATASLESQLQNMGLSRGSAAWNREKQRLGDQQSRERFQAMEFGGNEMSRQFGMGLQSSSYANQLRQQQIAEQLQQRAIPLNELNALLTGSQVATPGMPSFAASRSPGGADYSGALGSQYGAQQEMYNAQQATNNANTTAGAGIGAAAIAAIAAMMSDVRLKTNIVRIGTHPIHGVGIYEYDIQGERERGVLAHEVQQVRPDLVREHRSGYLMVDYGGL
jgi:hypothetical protein